MKNVYIICVRDRETKQNTVMEVYENKEKAEKRKEFFNSKLTTGTAYIIERELE